MPRKERMEFAGGVYHVMDRGDRLEAIYEDDRDREMVFAHAGAGDSGTVVRNGCWYCALVIRQAAGKMDCSKMTDEEHWYCIRARPRHERAAKMALRADTGLDVFCPMLTFERARRSGKVRVTEAMFPGYLFAKFDYGSHYRLVRATNGVSTIVSFGGIPSIVPSDVIAELRAAVSEAETVVIPSRLTVGGEVQLIEGPFRGIRAVITGVLPARARVTVLLELLGMEREVEVAETAVLPDIPHPMAAR